MRIHLRFIMTKVINKKTSCFFAFSRCIQHSCLLFHGTEEVSNDGQDPCKEEDCNDINGSYSRTCKGDYVRPFQQCKDVKANLTKTNFSLNCACKGRYTGDSHEKKLISS